MNRIFVVPKGLSNENLTITKSNDTRNSESTQHQFKPPPLKHSKRLSLMDKQKISGNQIPVSAWEKFGLVLSICSFIVGIIVLIWSNSLKSNMEYTSRDPNTNKNKLRIFNVAAKIFSWFKLVSSVTIFSITIGSYITRNSRIIPRHVYSEAIGNEANESKRKRSSLNQIQPQQIPQNVS